MKTFWMFFLIFSVVLGNAQEIKKSKKELKAEKKQQQIEEVKMLLNEKTFVFDALHVNPLSGGTINLTSNYDVKIKNDSLFSHLPYYGRAYSVNYGGESPMIFDLPIEKYSMEPGKKGIYMVKAEVKNKMDNVEFTFHIAETGSATLTVLSNNRQSISYFGNIAKIEEKTGKE